MSSAPHLDVAVSNRNGTQSEIKSYATKWTGADLNLSVSSSHVVNGVSPTGGTWVENHQVPQVGPGRTND